MNDGEHLTTTLRPPSKGDRDTVLEGLFRDHYPSMVRVAYCLMGDRAASEDAAQEAFASLHRHWDGVRDSGALGGVSAKGDDQPVPHRSTPAGQGQGCSGPDAPTGKRAEL